MFNEIESNENPEKIDLFPLPSIKDIEEIRDLKLRRSTYFFNAKKIAVHRAGSEFGLCIDILRNSYVMEKKNVGELPPKLFAWDMKHLMDRLQANTIWMSVLNRNYTPEELEIKKFVTDLNELEYYFLLILHNYLQSDLYSIFKSILHTLRCYLNLQKLEQEFVEEYQKNKNVAEETASILLEMELQSVQLQRVYTTYGDVEIIEPIIRRYQMAYIQSREYQFKLEFDIQFEKLEKQTEDYISKIKSDDYVSNQILVLYSMHIAPLRERIRTMEQKYETDFDRVVHENEQIKSKMNKITIKRTYLEQHIELFKKDTDAWIQNKGKRQQRISYEDDYVVSQIVDKGRLSQQLTPKKRNTLPRLSKVRRSSFKVEQLKKSAAKLARK